MLRGAGVPWDLRKAQPYECYDELDFDIPVGKNGDCFDRYLVPHRGDAPEPAHHAAVRRADARGPGADVENNKVTPPKRGEMKRSMEALIHHFKLYTEGYHVPAGETYTRRSRRRRASSASIWCRTARTSPISCKIRAPGFAHLQAMDFMSASGHMLADSRGRDRYPWISFSARSTDEGYKLDPEQPDGGAFAFTPETRQWAKTRLSRAIPEGRQASAVIALLDLAQRQNGGWLPNDAIEYVADYAGAWPRSGPMRSRPSTPCSTWSRSGSTSSRSAVPRPAGCAAPTA